MPLILRCSKCLTGKDFHQSNSAHMFATTCKGVDLKRKTRASLYLTDASWLLE